MLYPSEHKFDENRQKMRKIEDSFSVRGNLTEIKTKGVTALLSGSQVEATGLDAMSGLQGLTFSEEL